MRSDESIPKYRVAHSTKWITLEWVMTTPFDTPVEPDVNRMWAASTWLFRDFTVESANNKTSSHEKHPLVSRSERVSSTHPTCVKSCSAPRSIRLVSSEAVECMA